MFRVFFLSFLLATLATGFTFVAHNGHRRTALNGYSLDGRTVGNPVEPLTNFVLVKVKEVSTDILLFLDVAAARFSRISGV